MFKLFSLFRNGEERKSDKWGDLEEAKVNARIVIQRNKVAKERLIKEVENLTKSTHECEHKKTAVH
jgi:hypothetical protein